MKKIIGQRENLIRALQTPHHTAGRVTAKSVTSRKIRTAAVLVPFVERSDGYSVVFTKRSPDLTDHPGQISFPGGCVDGLDADLVATAKREAFEEIGIIHHQVEVITTLPEVYTGTGFVIHPVVALVDSRVAMVANPAEVHEIFEVPLAFLLTAQNYRTEMIQTSVGLRNCETIHFNQFRIWGATAMIIAQFRQRIEDYSRLLANG